MIEAAQRALELCLDAALARGSLALGLRDYGRLTGVSARMLIHYFGTKEGLEAALLKEVERRLLGEVLTLLAEPHAMPIDVVHRFSANDHAPMRRLLRLLVGRAFSGDAAAARVLRIERDRWRLALAERYGSGEEIEQALFILVGGAFDTLLSEA
jgi:AcrR family transcriptional regulator